MATTRQGRNFYKGRNKPFDSEKLANDMLAKRDKEKLTFTSVSEETGIAISMLHRAESAEMISLNNLASLCNWLKKPVQTYFK